MMRILFVITLFFFSQNLFSQEEVEEKRVFKVVEEMPRFPGCEELPKEERKQCAENEMLKFIYTNIRYPEMAREKGVEGKVVIQFVVGKDGAVIDPKVLRDIGEGCGDEVIRVMNLMQKEITWVPGVHKGKTVKVQYTLPVRFKLEGELPPPPPPYYLFGADTVYHSPTSFPEFKEGEDGLKQFLAMNTIYPESGLDSCSIGTVVATLMVKKDGKVDMLETRDFNQLGTDFVFEAIRVIPQFENKFKPATFNEKDVNSFYAMRIDFKPTSETCKSIVENYEKCEGLAADAFQSLTSKEYDLGLEKINAALNEFPNNTEWLTTQGMMFFGLKQNENACGSFQKIKEIEMVTNFDTWIETICRF